jgi:ribonucleoside-diphosphate reductase alpha chain
MDKWTSMSNPMFRSKFSEDIFLQKYQHDGCETWERLCATLVEDVMGDNATKGEKQQLTKYMVDLKFIPGGRYLYYAGREHKFFNNCFLLKAEEDTREDWAELSKKVELCLSTGGGIGTDYSIYRARGSLLRGTGGTASGPIPKMQMVNDQGRGVMQGGSRRSALYASLDWEHEDIPEFLVVKNWYDRKVAGTRKSLGELREADFNFPVPLDHTNISINYNTAWLENYWDTNDVGDIFKQNIRQALSTGEPGFSFNFWEKENETLRNACTEVTSEDDSDVCNLGSINIGRVDSIKEFRSIVELATMFLLCGTLVAKLPYEKVGDVREKNRRLGLGLMGIHEWLIKRGEDYEVTDELHRWLSIYRGVSNKTSHRYANSLSVTTPVANRAIAPTGSIGILAGTTTGIEPLFAVAYKRRYLKGTKWHYQYVVDGVAQEMLQNYDTDPSDLSTSMSLAADPRKRLNFQADVQDYVDMAISSTINLPKWGTGRNTEDNVDGFTELLASYAHRLRGFTCYPDGCRGGQPLVAVDYKEAVKKLGEEFEEHIEITDICDIKSGESCGS